MKKLNLTILGLLVTSAAFADVRVPMGEAMKAAVNKVQPTYNSVARQMKVSGAVQVEATVDTDGNVESVKAVTGNPLLTASAIAAVQKWKFTPFQADGKPSKAIVSLSFDFRP
jgi:protein TonB